MGRGFRKPTQAYTRLSVILPLTLMCMFILLLLLRLEKFRQAALVLSIVPLALFGGMLALNVRGMTLNVSSAVGFIAMFGLSIQNGIIMVSQINNLRKGGMELRKSVIEGARSTVSSYPDDLGHYGTRTVSRFSGNRDRQ